MNLIKFLKSNYFRGCLNRIPYASVIAFVMCFVGVIMFAIMMVFSFNASVEQARRALEISNIPWLDKVKNKEIFNLLIVNLGSFVVFNCCCCYGWNGLIFAMCRNFEYRNNKRASLQTSKCQTQWTCLLCCSNHFGLYAEYFMDAGSFNYGYNECYVLCIFKTLCIAHRCKWK